jgi:hypothetical protein
MGQSIQKGDSIEMANKIDDWNKGWNVKDHKLTTRWYDEKGGIYKRFDSL